ncbi:MAG: FAD-binding protein [Thermodesulfobacteriota bacterium]
MMLPSSADVLILGAGLAGLRAGLSCLEAAPGLKVVVASLTDGPSGSSFANGNDALGIHACQSDTEREAYVREVLALNRGALLSETLLSIQAEEGEARLRDLTTLGLSFIRDESGALMPHSSCFSPHSRRAFIFTRLADAYRRFRDRLDSLGCAFAHGWMPARILGNPVSGVLFIPAGGGAPTTVRARAVVAALGGPSRLFAHTMAGPGVPGYGQGLLARAGARMANQGYLQYMWGSVPGKRFWMPAETGSGGWTILMPEGSDRPGALVRMEDMVPGLAVLAASRAGHCPYGYGLEDAAIDHALLRGLGGDGVVTVVRPDGSRHRIAPMAHASNGGAVIDGNAETSVPGLLACGECATGMHGANRLGGCMVLATQVFGHRAGLRAAELALDAGSEPSGDGNDEGPEGICEDAGERREGLRRLAEGMSLHAVPGRRPGRRAFAAEMESRRDIARDWFLSLCLETTSGILAGMAYGAY